MNRVTALPSHSVDLSAEQLRAARHDWKTGAAYVIAGAGTGKTQTLIGRVVHLIETGTDPETITLTTFTRRATAELRQRLGEAYGAGSSVATLVEITTIDGLVQRLHHEAAAAGIIPPSQLISPSEQRVLLLELLCIADPQFNRHGDEFQREILDQLQKHADYDSGKPGDLPKKVVNKVISEYDSKLQVEHLGTYATRQAEVIRALPRLRGRKTNSRSCRHLLVDEFQDTSRAQLEFVMKLMPRSGKGLWVVGDPCQQIYQWRGASPQNFQHFRKHYSPKRYQLSGNRRSHQPILDTSYLFLGNQIPALKRRGDLICLQALREPPVHTRVITGAIDQILADIAEMYALGKITNLGDVVILSNKLTKPVVEGIRRAANHHRLDIEVRSSRTDHVLRDVLQGSPPNWAPQAAHTRMLNHRRIQDFIRKSLKRRDFDSMRRMRCLAESCNNFDSQSSVLKFSEAWPAVSKAKAQEVGVTEAISSRIDAIQVMTIHAAKGLEFPVVVVMTFSDKSFPKPGKGMIEDARVGYVGMTRARDRLYLARTKSRGTYTEVMKSFGPTMPCKIRRSYAAEDGCKVDSIEHASIPIIAASHLNYYHECPLKFASFHEGRFLPEWSMVRSAGARLHKALEYFLRQGCPSSARVRNDCLEQGIRDGDSQRRRLTPRNMRLIRDGYAATTRMLNRVVDEVVGVEQPFDLVLQNGQIDGVADALIRTKEGRLAVYEWKTTKKTRGVRKQEALLQVAAAAKAFEVTRKLSVDDLIIVPILSPSPVDPIQRTAELVQSVDRQLDDIFSELQHRRYDAKPSKAVCENCPLNLYCTDAARAGYGRRSTPHRPSAKHHSPD